MIPIEAEHFDQQHGRPSAKSSAMKNGTSQFNISLVLPESLRQGVGTLDFTDLDVFIDYTEESPGVLIELCRTFALHGVRFQMTGFFVNPLALDAEFDLQDFLEELPGLLRFLDDSKLDFCKVGLWQQRTEIQLSFDRDAPTGMVEVRCASGIECLMRYHKEFVPLRYLIQMFLDFVTMYKTAVMRFSPINLQHQWNKSLFALADRLSSRTEQV